jgi:hypothetical protein
MRIQICLNWFQKIPTLDEVRVECNFRVDTKSRNIIQIVSTALLMQSLLTYFERENCIDK